MIDVDTVQSALEAIGPMQKFRVVFKKVNGEDREMVCMMDFDNGNRGNSVPVMEVDTGLWKSFRLDRVVVLELV